MRFAVAALTAAMFAAPVLADVSYNATSFESLGYAWTDAGDEYAYSINAGEEADASGVYSFSQFGSAPGYDSSATVGVVHSSSLTSSGFHLSGRAFAYVADDYGYAACSANSESIAYVSFTIDSNSAVTITGSLGLTGSSAPQAFSNYFELRNASNQIVATADATDTISFSQNLPAGDYTVYVSASVYRELNFSGGDAYENSSATFDLTLSATASN